MKREIPELWLEQYRLGELSPERRATVEAALGDQLSARLAALDASDAEVLRALPPRVFATRVQDAPVASSRSPWLVALPALAVAVLMVVAGPSLLATSGPDVEVTRVKGDPMLQVFKRQGDVVEPLSDGDGAQAGDVLQVSYTSGGAEFGAVGSIDGNGVVTWHLPLRGSHAVVLQKGSGVPLSESYQLDDAPSHEHFFFVTSPADFDLADVEEAVHGWSGGEDLRLTAPMRSTVFTVQKGATP